MKHYEDRRRDVIRIVKEERVLLMEELEGGSKVLNGSRHSGSPLGGVSTIKYSGNHQLL
jgi:hypothetical protein